MGAVTQRQNELSRIVVEGRRTDGGDLCTLVMIRKSGGTWALYPYGVCKFGTRLSRECAVTMARAILADADRRSHPPHCIKSNPVSAVS